MYEKEFIQIRSTMRLPYNVEIDSINLARHMQFARFLMHNV